ncbi:hypothetical protein KVH22_25530 [Streptomyces olivaceus]|uniref:hypothetical protein n=1 Tax=Streptomyces olivaceus TaxID=47716 RepID=UPI001CCB6550|nr:hypothetical protein [Streptomyces olivaceus]MBZ6258881.1 hypothetical protein [Streptomyces olivaceus]
MDITTEPRDQGVYAIRRVGRQQWAEGGGTWQAHGVRLELMDGHATMATCTLEIAGTAAAEELGGEVAAAIEPWVPALRYLRVTDGLRRSLRHAQDYHDAAVDAAAEMYRLEGYQREGLYGMASQQEIDDAAAAARPADDFGLLAGAPDSAEQDIAVAAAVVRRLTSQVDRGLRGVYGRAPDPAAHPIHPAWELPQPARGATADSLASYMARGMLAGWAAVRDGRDALITWAVREAELTPTEVQQVSGVSRSTIARLLPGSGD